MTSGSTRNRRAIHSGIGDHDDLLVKRSTTEDTEQDFSYGVRLRGKQKQETVVYPEIPFEYGIQYTGQTLETDNEKEYRFDLLAHPEKKIAYGIEETKELPVKRLWEARACFEAEVARYNLQYALQYKGHTGVIDKRTAEYAVNWRGQYNVRNHGDVKDLFTDANGHFIGYGDGSTGWKRSGNHVEDARNRSFFSGVVAKDMYNWNAYEASFSFKPILNDGAGNFGNTRRYNWSTKSFYHAGKWDDDIVGLIFQAQDRKNFYMMMWEADERIWLSGRSGNNLDGIDITKNDAEFVNRQAVSPITGGSPSHSDWVNYNNNYGWGNKHYRIYKVTNGVMKRVHVSMKGPGKGWVMNNMHRVRIVTAGANVKIYARTSPNASEFLMFDFNTDWSKGSFGMFNVSQSVEFHSIDVIERRVLEGRIPESGWDKSTAATRTVSNNATTYVRNSASFKGKLPSGVSASSVSMMSITGSIRNSDNGSISIASRTGKITVKAKDYSTRKNYTGRIPKTGWYEFDGVGDHQLTNNAQAFIQEKSGVKGLTLDSIEGIVRDKKAGGVFIQTKTGPIIARSANAKDAGKVYSECFIRCGIVEVTPDHRDYRTGLLVFADIATVFKEDYAAFFHRSDYINKKATYELLKPVRKDPPKPPPIEESEGGCVIEEEPPPPEEEPIVECLHDFDFDGKKLVMWSCAFPVDITTKYFEEGVFAYRGWTSFNPLQHFEPNKWTSYTLLPEEATMDPRYDEIQWAGRTDYEKAPAGTKVLIRTKEWYKAIFPADIKNTGIVTNEEDVVSEIPPAPEHFWHPEARDATNIEERMPDHFEVIHYLLDAWDNHPDVVISFESNPSLTTENADRRPASLAYEGRMGMPIILTSSDTDRVVIHCKEDPRYYPWHSGKYIGYGKVNGKRPFWGDDAGKADMVNIPTDVVFFPANLVHSSLSEPIIDIYDPGSPETPRVTFTLHADKQKVDFSSDYTDIYEWYTDWYSPWVEEDNTHTATLRQVKEIQEPLILHPGEMEDYDPNTTVVEGVEVTSNNPFVKLWTEASSGMRYRLFAQVKQATPLPWHPMLHNGYYYQEDQEHYLYAEKVTHSVTPNSQHEIMITPRPQQGSAIIVRDNTGKSLRKVTFYDDEWNLTLENKEAFSGNGYATYYLQYQDIDGDTVEVSLNGNVLPKSEYLFHEETSCIEFMKHVTFQDAIEVRYILRDSYYLEMNAATTDGWVLEDTAKIVLHDNYDPQDMSNMEVIYEGAKETPFYRATEITVNPIFNHRHTGFLYLTEVEAQDVHRLTAHISHPRISDSGKEKVLVTAQVLDSYQNPCPKQTVTLYRDGTLVATTESNVAGEVYFEDTPTPPSNMVSTYVVVCEHLQQEVLLHFYPDNQPERYHVDIHAPKLSVFAGVEDEALLTVTLRDHDWKAVGAGHALLVEIRDSHGNLTQDTIPTDAFGQAVIALSGKDEQHGNLMVKVSYDMGFEHSASYVHVKVIGG